jgi:hypothetical protein
MSVFCISFVCIVHSKYNTIFESWSESADSPIQEKKRSKNVVDSNIVRKSKVNKTKQKKNNKRSIIIKIPSIVYQQEGICRPQW